MDSDNILSYDGSADDDDNDNNNTNNYKNYDTEYAYYNEKINGNDDHYHDD